jgi:hypothetical protein
MTCHRKATRVHSYSVKSYSTAGQCSPFAYQQELTLQRQHDPHYADRTAQDQIQTEDTHGG